MKHFLVIANINALTYKEVFPYIKDGIIKYRPNRIKNFLNGITASTWYTTLIVPELPPLELTKAYNSADYPKYDNYDAIEVSRTKDIPFDYEGVMGVPISFLDKYNPNQFNIIGTIGAGGEFNYGKATIKGCDKYKRLLIKKKQP